MTAQPTHHGRIVLREASSIFPTAPPAPYAFLASSPGRRRINIHHPGYDINDDLLFTLYALDHELGGIHHGLAHTACAIVAGNRHDGYLSESRGGNAIHAGMDDVLHAGDYYFHVPRKADDEIAATSPYRYPIVPSFQDWKFPSTLPEAWTRPYYTDRACYTAPQSTLTAAIRARDMTCRITTHFTATGVAHLCPEHEQEWFLRNSMQSWNSDLTLDPDNLLNDLSNAILLRPDLHAAFDDRKFVFFPKSEDGFVVHMLEPTPDLAQLYHNVRLQPLWQCNAQFLYARFAWAIFPSLSGFLSKPNAAPLVLVVKSNGGHTEWVEEESVTSEKLRARVSASRSQSLKKRQPAADKDSLGSVDDDGAYLGRKRQRTVVPAEKVVHTVSGTYDNGSQEQVEGSWVAGRHETTETSYEDKTLAEMELEEDQNMLCVSLQDLKDHQKPVSWYPGWRRVQRLKDRWLEQTRPLGYEPAKTTRHISFRSGKKVDRACCVTDIFTSAGFEVMDTFSEEGE